MRILMFTKPKQMTLECLKHLYFQGECILGVVIYGLGGYRGTEFYRFCKENRIRMYDGDEIYLHMGALEEKLDIIYVNTYPKLIKSELIKLASKGGVNFHSAPLPNYKGVFGFNFAIYNQECEYGVTAHKLSDRFDEGEIIEVDKFPIDPSRITVKELVELSEAHLLELFKKVHMYCRDSAEIQGIAPGAGHYYSRSDFERLKEVQLDDTPQVIDRKIRACWYPPYEGAYIEIAGKRYSLFHEDAVAGVE